MKKLLVIAGGMLLLAACGQGGDKKAELDKLIKERDALNEKIVKLQEELSLGQESNKKAVNVAVYEVTPVTFKHYIEVQGKVDGDENVAVSAKTAGVVVSVNVQEGQKVSRGQVLATLDAQVYYQTKKELEAQLAFATDIYNRQKNLWDQQIGSEIQYLTAKNNKESLENKMKTLDEQIAMTRITSPINGTVEEIPIKIGQSLAPGLPAFRVVNFDKIKVVAEVAEAYSPKVRTGDSVVIFFPDLNTEIRTRLTFTSKYINSVNRTFLVETRIVPGKFEFRANMIAVIRINDYSVDQAVAVPANVVQKAMNEQYVLVAANEQGKKVARKRPVSVGLTYNGLTEITSGLKQGDLLIVSGFQDLNDNDPVNF